LIGNGRVGNKVLEMDMIFEEENSTISYSATKVIGNGSFGVVFQATICESGELVAIKKVLQDKRFKNRELSIMRVLNQHQNIVQLKHCFYSSSNKESSTTPSTHHDEVYLNLVLEFIPETIYRFTKHYSKIKKSIPNIMIKLYMYQLLRSLAYIHSLGIAHRDIKPQNLLLDPHNHILKLCDFGSAKKLELHEPNISYICSRYYRAPELIFGATNYSTAIDIWSSGCVLCELILLHPIFPGDSGVDQLVAIIKVLGTPTKEEIFHMNSEYKEFKFPLIDAVPWTKVFKQKVNDECTLQFIEKLLKYDPNLRMNAKDALADHYFDELRHIYDGHLQSDIHLPPLFNFNEAEKSNFGEELLHRILPQSLSQK